MLLFRIDRLNLVDIPSFPVDMMMTATEDSVETGSVRFGRAGQVRSIRSVRLVPVLTGRRPEYLNCDPLCVVLDQH